MKCLSRILKKAILGLVSLFLVAACNYNKTELKVGSLFDPTFDFSNISALSFDQNYVEIKNGKAQLKPLDLKQEGNDFNSGNHQGSILDSNNNISIPEKISVNDVSLILPSKNSDLSGHWKFDDDYDDSGANDLDGTGSANISFSSDCKLGSHCLLFDGPSEYAILQNSSAMSPGTDNFFIGTWFQCC